MVYLVLSVLSSVAIANLLTWFYKDRRSDIMLIFAGNYLVASIFSWGTNRVPVSSATNLDLIMGAVAGGFFLMNFLIYQRNIIKNGQSIAVGVMRISLIIPTMLSILVISERLLLYNYFGIIIIMIAFMHLSSSGSIKNIMLALALFFMTGITDSYMKFYDEYGKDDPSLYIAILFTSALIVTVSIILIKKKSFHLRSLCYGFVLGIPNQLTTKFFMTSLAHVKAAIAYPFFASGVVLLAIITDITVWKRKITGKGIIGYAALLIGIILLNIKW